MIVYRAFSGFDLVCNEMLFDGTGLFHIRVQPGITTVVQKCVVQKQ